FRADGVGIRAFPHSDVLDHSGGDHGVERTRTKGQVASVRKDERPPFAMLRDPAGQAIPGDVDAEGLAAGRTPGGHGVAVAAAEIEQTFCVAWKALGVVAHPPGRGLVFQALGFLEELARGRGLHGRNISWSPALSESRRGRRRPSWTVV